MKDIADDIMDNACLPQAFYQNGVDASIRAAIRDAIRDAVAEKDAEIERLREEVKAMRSALGDANGCEPIGCPLPGACACVRHDNVLPQQD